MSTRLCNPLVPEATETIEYKIASSFEERSAAFELVYHSYLEAGLGQPNRAKMRVTPYHLLPTTQIFIATHHGEVAFTMSLVCDGELGLPIESVYPEEVAQRRSRGRLLAEISCLADRRSQFRGFFPVFLRLSRLVGQYALRAGLEELLVAVHPRHARFYQRYLRFEPIGALRSYPTVRDNPAVALSLDLLRADRLRLPPFDDFFGNPLPPEVLEAHPIPEPEAEYFAAMVDPSFHAAPILPCEKSSPCEAAATSS